MVVYRAFNRVKRFLIPCRFCFTSLILSFFFSIVDFLLAFPKPSNLAKSNLLPFSEPTMPPDVAGALALTPAFAASNDA